MGLIIIRKIVLGFDCLRVCREKAYPVQILCVYAHLAVCGTALYTTRRHTPTDNTIPICVHLRVHLLYTPIHNVKRHDNVNIALDHYTVTVTVVIKSDRSVFSFVSFSINDNLKYFMGFTNFRHYDFANF